MRERGVSDPAVLSALGELPRHAFVPQGVSHRAYRDAALPIGYGQTVSQPSIQALYVQSLELSGHEKVLEIGTGSGYQTALLAAVAEHVYSVERVRELSRRAQQTFDALGIRNVALLVGDGTVGWSRYAPYDAIVVTAGAPEVPDALLGQLADGGRLLIPVGNRKTQTLVRVTRRGDEYPREEVIGCSFVPLLGRFGWSGGEIGAGGGHT